MTGGVGNRKMHHIHLYNTLRIKNDYQFSKIKLRKYQIYHDKSRPNTEQNNTIIKRELLSFSSKIVPQKKNML